MATWANKRSAPQTAQGQPPPQQGPQLTQPQPQPVKVLRPRIGATGRMGGMVPPEQPKISQPAQPTVQPVEAPQPGRMWADKKKELPYNPTWGQTPSEIAKAYQTIQATPADQLPPWLAMQQDQIKQAYDWYAFRNDGKPWTEWKHLDPTDPAHEFLMGLQGPPKVDENGQPVNDQPFATIEQAQQGQANWTDVSPQDRQAILADPTFDIAQYPSWQQQQILADPSFNWDKLPKWQRLYYSLSSNPTGMGAVQGGLMGAGGGPVAGLGGIAVGAGLGYAANKSGYDQTKEFWQQDNKVAGAFGLLNWFAEQAEKGIGMGVQIAGILSGNVTIDPTKRNLNWDAGAVTFETLAPAYIAATGGGDGEFSARDFYSRIPIVALYDVAEMIINPEKYKGVELLLGRKDPLKLEETFYERIQEANARIEAGENYRVVMTDFQNGVVAQMGDMVGQAVADPLNSFGETTSAVGEGIARVQGNEVAAAAFASSNGLADAARKYQNLINNPGEALKIDPNFKTTELGWLGKTVAGLTSDAKVKAGLFDFSGDLLNNNKQKNKIVAFIDYTSSLTPESRARVAQDLLIRNLGGVMASYFGGTDVKGFAQWWKAFSNNDMTVSADLSRNLANSPEFYTVLPAAKDFNIDGMVSAWDISEPRRQDVTRIADILGENPMTLIDDLHKRGTAAEDFTRIQERLKQAGTPEAAALLADIEAGRFTEASLAEAVKVFGDGTVPFHPGQWMAMTLDALKTHYDEWAVNHFKLDEDSRKTLFRMSHVMKSAQSILLLGANPGYMISNVLPTMVTRAMSGVYGYMTPKAIDTFMTRMGFSLDEGFTPNRLDEGVGPSGMVEQATGRSGSRDLISEATRGTGALTNIQNVLGRIGSAMPFNKLSRLLEGYEGKQAFLIGIKKAWGESWIRDKGFRRIPADLAAELTRTVGPRATEILYSAIEAGMNKAELDAIVRGRSADVQSRTLITDAAKELNIPSNRAAKILDQVGVLDALDSHLKGANNPGKIEAAFKRARQTAQEAIDIQAWRDISARIEHIANRLNIEGPKAFTDIVLDVEMRGIEQWARHLENMGEVADAVDSVDNAATRSKMWSSAYAQDIEKYRSYASLSSSTWLGLLKAIKLDSSEVGRGWLATTADTFATIDRTYTEMRNLRDGHFEKWNNEWQNPERQAERTKIERQIEKLWADATKREVDNLRKMGELLGQQYDQLFGVEAGEAARQAWEQITDFRKEMVKRRDDFRKSIEGVPNPERQIRSKEFWDGTYKYMIVEMSRIKQEAIARLDRIARGERGGDVSGAPATPNGPEPTGGGGVDSLRADYARPWNEAMRNQAEISQRMDTFTNRTNVPTVQEERAALRQQAAERQQIKDEKISAFWDIAEQYSKKLPNNSSNFNRGSFQDKPHLFNTLKNAEYGGDPTIKTWDDAIANLTPEKVKEILDARDAVKDEGIKVFEAEQQARFMDEMAKAKARAEARKAPENLTLLQAIRKRGGIDTRSWIAFNEKPEGYQPGVFSQNGKNRWALDQIARLLADDGYPINIDEPTDIGGINQTVDLIKRARAGEDIYPITHDFVIDAEVNKAQAEYLANEAATSTEIDLPTWEASMTEAIQSADHARMIDLWEQLPEDMANNALPTGETYAEYFSRSYDEVTARLQSEEQTNSIAENMVRAEQSIKAQEAAAQTAMTRQRFRESLTEVFGLDESMANAVMDITDARANAYGNADEWYATRIAEVTKAGSGSQYFQKAEAIDTPAFKQWFGDSKVVDDEGKPLVLYHGSTFEFDSFNWKDKGNPENHFGRGYYFTNDEADVQSNYAGKGTDLTAKVERRAEEILNSYIDNMKNPPKYGTEKYKKLQAKAEKEAGKLFNADAEGKVYPVYVKMENPVYFTKDDNATVFSFEIDEDGNESGNGVDLYNSVIETAYDYGIDGQEVWGELTREIGDYLYDGGGIKAIDIDEEFRKLNSLMDLMDDNGNITNTEFIRDVFKNAGYDGFIQDANLYFGQARRYGKAMDGVDYGTYHYIVFEPTQVKAEANSGAFDPNNENMYMQADATTNAKGGVQFLDDGRAIIRAFDKADVSTVVHELGHIFRRDLKGTDLATIEEWAGVKDGVWDVKAEEKFARGFEKYLADGEAPTPKLRRVFEQFKQWMAKIYQAITGSPIDIELTPQVREVFGNLFESTVKADDGISRAQVEAKVKELYQADTVKPKSVNGISGYNIDETLINNLREATKGIDVQAYLSQKDNVITLHDIVVPKEARNQGTGTRFMDALTSYADKNGMTIVLTAAGDFGGSKAGQRRFYSRSGFNKNNDYRFRENMIRRPSVELFQSADPRMPLGGYEQSAGWIPNSDVMDEGWTKEVQPLLEKMQEGAIRKLTEPTMDGAYRDLSPEGQRMMNQYINGVKQDMASTKLAAQRWGAEQRDFTMLNYNKRYGLHQMLDVAMPYEFFYTATMITTMMRMIDNPAILSNYARLRMQQDRYENNLPERLRGKVRIEAPYLPDWMGDAVYIDPLSVLFTPHNFLRPYEQMVKDKNMQQIEAERIMQEWAADGTVPLDQLQQAAETKSGSVYERALAEAKIRREAEISNPLDFVATMLGPAWYLTTPYKLATGKGKEISELPITRTARAIDTVTQGTWAEPVGDILGLLAKPEEAARTALNLPQMGEYGDYYIDRNIANMVAEGLITPADAQIAMIERKGEIFDQAQERTRMELAMRVPLAGTIYAGLNEGPAAGAQAFLPSLFGAGLLPEGELTYRGLKDEWNAAWKLKDAGDDQAITKFFEDHPEYEAYLAKGKPPEERLKSFLIGQIWDGYMALGDTDRKQATATMGQLFKDAFLNSETRSYDTLDVETLTTWAQMLNMKVPNVPETAPAIGNAPEIPFYPEDVTAVTDKFFQERKQLHPNYYMLEQGYYSLPPSKRAEYLLKFPQLQSYYKWRDGYYERYPELKPIFKGQVFKQVDTSSWPVGLEGYVTDYAYTGKKLPSAAKKALEQVWIREGKPMGDMETWLQSQVVPALLYQQGAGMVQ